MLSSGDRSRRDAGRWQLAKDAIGEIGGASIQVWISLLTAHEAEARPRLRQPFCGVATLRTPIPRLNPTPVADVACVGDTPRITQVLPPASKGS